MSWKNTVRWHSRREFSRKEIWITGTDWDDNSRIVFNRYRYKPWDAHMYAGDNNKHRRTCVARVITKRTNNGIGE